MRPDNEVRKQIVFANNSVNLWSSALSPPSVLPFSFYFGFPRALPPGLLFLLAPSPLVPSFLNYNFMYMHSHAPASCIVRCANLDVSLLETCCQN